MPLDAPDQGHAFIDRHLYLPKAWTGDPVRRQAAHVPEAVTFATEPRLALAMIERAIQAEVPFAWVAADSVYGVGWIELALRRAYKGYVLGVTDQHRFWSWDINLDVAGTAADIAEGISDQDWLRLSAGAGTKGARLLDWAYLPLATLRADALDAALDQSLWTRGLLARRGLSHAVADEVAGGKACASRGNHQPFRATGSAMKSLSPTCRQSSAERPVILAT